MMQITFNPTDPAQLTAAQQDWWNHWSQRAETATENVIKSWEEWLNTPDAVRPEKFKPKWDEVVWKDLRDWLLDNVFDGKCAYCEHKMVRAAHHGEHFRPKGQVKVRPLGGTRMKAGVTRQEWHAEENERVNDVPHPGYFWLAYHWKNIVPACEACNTRQGKKDQFPVAAPSHVAVKRVTPDILASLKEQKIQSSGRPDLFYLQPDDLDAMEDRLLLHPYLDDPSEHLIFSETGVVAARPECMKGQHSIAVYDLNGEELVKDRYNWQQVILTKYYMAFAAAVGSIQQRQQAAEAVLADYRREGGEYIAAILATVRESIVANLADPARSPVPPDE